MEITSDIIEGIIKFADKYPVQDRDDIANAILDSDKNGYDLQSAESDEIVHYLEITLI